MDKIVRMMYNDLQIPHGDINPHPLLFSGFKGEWEKKERRMGNGKNIFLLLLK